MVLNISATIVPRPAKTEAIAFTQSSVVAIEAACAVTDMGMSYPFEMAPAGNPYQAADGSACGQARLSVSPRASRSSSLTPGKDTIRKGSC